MELLYLVIALALVMFTLLIMHRHFPHFFQDKLNRVVKENPNLPIEIWYHLRLAGRIMGMAKVSTGTILQNKSLIKSFNYLPDTQSGEALIVVQDIRDPHSRYLLTQSEFKEIFASFSITTAQDLLEQVTEIERHINPIKAELNLDRAEVKQIKDLLTKLA